MAEVAGVLDQHHPNLHLSPEERRLFGQLFAAADQEKLNVVTGEVAVKFFEKTRLPSAVLGEIWQIADVENRGLLTPAGFGIVLRLIGYAQAGQQVSAELALKPGGPLPRFDGISAQSHSTTNPSLSPLQPQGSGSTPIRVPPLTPDKAEQFSLLFQQSGAQDGSLSGENAKQLFEKVTHLPNEVLGQIWNLADTEQKGELNLTGFIIAMHLIACYRDGSIRALPPTLPAGLYEAASRRGVSRPMTGSRPPSGVDPTKFQGRQFSGSGPATVLANSARTAYQQSQPSWSRPPEEWAISRRDKDDFDHVFSTIDTANRGFVTGEQAVVSFRNSKLSEDALAQIWDLADINSEGRLNRDEFAVAMFLIRQQKAQRDGRDVLPKTLPLNLVPPSMRPQPRPAPQPAGPAFDSTVSSKALVPASEDLFGLDAWATPTTQIPQTTGDSGLYSATPPSIQGSPRQIQQSQQLQKPQPSSTIKPFVPSSSFGQAITSSLGQTTLTPQSTGTSPLPKVPGVSNRDNVAPNTVARQAFSTDDLLGDNDPEVSRKLTQETTELANLSNQVSNLTGQMQAVKSNRMSTEQDISNAQSQKREFESRLSQLRSTYEQEVIAVKTLEQQLSNIRGETKRLDQEMALVSGAHQDLQNQHGQVERSLELDQRENAELKERIRQTNIEINDLKPQLEKLKSDARQQKGLVAINKKQLATNENELDKLKGEVENASKEVEDATKEAGETARMVEKAHEAKGPASTIRPTSPTTSMNPFFRRDTSFSSEKTASSPFKAQSLSSPNHDAFENFFSSSTIPPYSQSGPPPTFFMPDSLSNYNEPTQQNIRYAYSIKSSEEPNAQTPSESPPTSTYNDTPQLAGEPPAPPKSRQITSSILPMRLLQRSESTSSSVKVVPPASRAGEPSDIDTPTDREFSSAPEPDILKQRLDMADADADSRVDSSQKPVKSVTEQGLPGLRQNSEEKYSFSDDKPDVSHRPSAFDAIPGAFPIESSLQSSLQPESSTSHDNPSTLPKNPELNLAQAQDSFEEGGGHLLVSREAKDDLNAAFNGVEKNGQASAISDGTKVPDDFGGSRLPQTRNEFPPIQDVGRDDDESDTDSGLGFDDNFTAASPQQNPKNPNEAKSSFSEEQNYKTKDNNLSTLRPAIATSDSNQSQLPTPGAQVSPPTYDQTVALNGQSSKRKNSNQFPAEYIGLLPSREILNTPPTSPPAIIPNKTGSATGNESGNGNGLGQFGGPIVGESLGSSSSTSGPPPLAPGASAAPYANDHSAPLASQTKPPVPAKTALDDDFDNELGDLSEAKEADDKVDDELGSTRRDGFDDFNPVFDSPAPSRSTTHPSSQLNQKYNSFHDFESANAAPGSSLNSRQPIHQSSLNQNYDWDAMIAGLDSSKPNGLKLETQNSQAYGPEQTNPPAAHSAFESTKPPLPRVLSSGTDHDDPILKRLTGMGYPRESSLKALEKFDYNIDKAADYLTSNP